MAGLTLSARATLSVLLALATAVLPAVARGEEPLQIFARFKSALEANDLDAAGDRARELVAATEARHGAKSRELVNPLTNLGTVHFRRGEFAQAEAAYQQAIGLIEGQLSGADRMLIRPLEGLGETWLATDRAAEAALALKRAVDLSRNLDGLYNAAQLDTVDALIEAYEAAGLLTEAEREHQNAFRIAETSFGKRDLRLLDPLDRYGRWFESVGRYATARGLHARALQLAEELAKENPVVGVPGLRGLARTWLLEAIYGPEVEAQPGFEIGEANDPFNVGNNQSRLNSEGLRALSYAVDLIRRSNPLNPILLGETLAQIGDWYLVSGSGARANAAYAESWRALSTAGAGATAVLAEPRVLIYRAPAASVARLRPSNPEDYAVREVDLRLTVGVDGKVTDVRVAESGAPENSTRAAVLAARKARFAPRIVDGAPAVAQEVVLRERLLIRTQPERPGATPEPAAPRATPEPPRPGATPVSTPD